MGGSDGMAIWRNGCSDETAQWDGAAGRGGDGMTWRSEMVL